MFTRGAGEALHPQGGDTPLRQAVKKAMLPAIRLHDLRHTHATLALPAGVHPKIVSERLGHATVSITLDTYSHAASAGLAPSRAKSSRVAASGAAALRARPSAVALDDFVDHSPASA